MPGRTEYRLTRAPTGFKVSHVKKQQDHLQNKKEQYDQWICLFIKENS